VTTRQPRVTRGQTSTSWGDLGQLPWCIDDRPMLRVSRANNRKSESNLTIHFHLLHDRSPSWILSQIRGVTHDVESVLGSGKSDVDTI